MFFSFKLVYIYIVFSKFEDERIVHRINILSNVRDSLIILVSPIVYERAMRANRLLYVIFIF